MKKISLQLAALAFALALTGALSCSSPGGSGGGSLCNPPNNTSDASGCDAKCGYGTYQYQCTCLADPKYDQSVANNNNSGGSAGSGVNNNNAGQSGPP